MFNRTAAIIGVSVLLGTGLLASTANALPTTLDLAARVSDRATHIEPAAQVWVYNRNSYGERFRYRHGPYRYYYGGWYYPRQWWTLPPVTPGVAVAEPYYSPYSDDPYDDNGVYAVPYVSQGYADDGYADDGYADEGDGVAGGYVATGGHVQYCMNRYRTYDPRSDSFIGYDRLRHPCVGP